jgi:FkbM family methyltransferase
MGVSAPNHEVFRSQRETTYGPLDKARQVARIGQHIGILATVKLVVDRLIAADQERARTITHPCLRHPLVVTSHDVSVFDETLIRGANTLPRRLQYIINGKPILDIGANIGATAALYASAYPDSQVIAIEPHPRNAGLLRANSQAYGTQIEVIEAAVALEPGVVPLDNPERELGHCFNGSFRFLDPTDQIPDGLTTAPAITLEELSSLFETDTRIGLMKVDIEGVEKRLFESTDMDPLLSQVDVLAIETHDRIMPGCQRAVIEATRRYGLVDISDSPFSYTRFFALAA